MATTIIMMFFEGERGIFSLSTAGLGLLIFVRAEYYRRRGCDCGRLSVCQPRKILKVTMADRYKYFLELAKKETQGIDFRVRLQQRAGKAVVLAPHGGGIEPGTSEIAEAIDGADFSFYAFEGIKPANNRILHITSTRFDEPQGKVLADALPTVMLSTGKKVRRKLSFLAALTRNGKNSFVTH
jgi:hypothetical protein